jgi:prolyl oligopeptidase
MKASTKLAVLFAPLFLFSACGTDAAQRTGAASIASTLPAPIYPDAPRGDVVDVYHGVEVADPYRWLENTDTPETRTWIEAQNALTNGWLDQIPERATLRERLTELWNYERYGRLSQKGGRMFYSHNDGLQDQAVFYVVDTPGAEPRVLLDPNTLSGDGTVALSGTAVSSDGSLMAYGLAESGSDWNVWKVRDVASGRDLDDEVRWVKFSGASWTKDGKGFFYSRYDAPTAGAEYEEQNFFHKLYYHRIGADQSADELIYERPDQAEWSLRGTVSDDGRWLVISSNQGTDRRSRIFVKDLEAGGPVTTLTDAGDATFSFIGNDGAVLWFRTDLDAPLARVIAVNAHHPERENWSELIASSEDALSSVSAVGGHLIAHYLQDAHSAVKVFDTDGAFVRDVELPGIGSSAGFGGDFADPITWYSFSGFTSPPVMYEYDVSSGVSKVYREPELRFDPSALTTEQVFYESRDGTRVPMFLTYRKDLERDGTNPALLYGYGGFNIAIRPSFSPARLAWIELGGIYAVANLRGGSEYGETWHQGGMKLNKQNVFDDFIAAGEWLVESGWTSPAKLAINGGSNGGLLVGACVNQRPDLFGAAIPAVGVMDMLRFPEFTIGWAWVSDYGSPEDPAEFEALYAYSPYHNTRPGTCYPPVMVTTSDHDDRVVPAHSFKYAAALQAAQGCANPVLIRIETKAGHGAGKPTSKRIEQAADEIGFLVRALDIEM